MSSKMNQNLASHEVAFLYLRHRLVEPVRLATQRAPRTGSRGAAKGENLMTSIQGALEEMGPYKTSAACYENLHDGMSEGIVEVGEHGMIAFTVRKNWLEVLKRPIEAETVPMNTGIALGRVNRVRLVDQTGFVCQGKEVVGDAHRKIKHIPIVLGKFYSRGLSVGFRGGTQIEKNIEDLPADAVNQLLMRSRWQLEVHAPQDAEGRFRKEFLAHR